MSHAKDGDKDAFSNEGHIYGKGLKSIGESCFGSQYGREGQRNEMCTLQLDSIQVGSSFESV